MDFTDKARKIFCNDRFATEATGIVIDFLDDQKAVCSLTLDSRHCNARGVAMGGAIYTLADFASAVAANRDFLDRSPLPWVSLDSSVHYLSPAVERQQLVATCTALKHGRSTALYQIIIECPDSGKRVAVVETTMICV